MIKRTVLCSWTLFFLFSCASSGSAQLPTIEKIDNYTPDEQERPAAAEQIKEADVVAGDSTVISLSSDTSVTRPVYPARKHQGAILCLDANPRSDSFFSGGTDGFITEQNTTGIMSFWQISDIPIRKIAVHPESPLVAAYESDGYSVHRLSVWNWASKQRVYAKRFKDSIVSLSWSARGTWLIVGNTSIEGVAVFKGLTGDAVSIFKQTPGIVSLAVTGESETSMITYGPSGRIAYTDLATGNERAVFQGISDLRNPVLYANNSKIAGYVDTELIVQEATTGKKSVSYSTQAPLLLSSTTDTELRWIEEIPSGGYSYKIDGNTYFDFSIPDGSTVTSVLGGRSNPILGTSAGNLYTLKIEGNAEGVPTVYPLANDGVTRIDDICSDGSRLFLIASGSLFISTGSGKSPVFSANSVPGNRITMSDHGLIVWSNSEPSPLVLKSIDGDTNTLITTVSEPIRSVSVYGNSVSIVEGTSLVRVLDIQSGIESYSYKGAGFQDAVIVDDHLLVISKSTTMRSPNSVLVVNTSTGETVPLPITGELCYGLKQSPTDPKTLGGFLIRADEARSTELISITINPAAITASQITTIALYPDEDLSASVYPSEKGLFYTTLGKNSLVSIDSASNRQYRFGRAFALPAKCTEMDQFLSCLNFDGSLSWYSKETKQLISTAYINEKGYWMEYPE